jgi:hypothetical protein
MSVNVLQNSIDDDGARRVAAAWKGHGSLTTICGVTQNQLDVSGGKLGDDLPVVLLEIANNGALSNFIFGDKETMNVSSEMTEANFSGKLQPCEIQIVAAFLPKCTYVPQCPYLS